ncbi:membrane protein [Streptomyces catenulae]|uniref:Integral membrane protein n=1 Tax=Streptomyces catenulae TaxID=66875 RepID=A0ABV2Z2N2_9ACTN|nr:membrane protein [Streptomyces catenulae]
MNDLASAAAPGRTLCRPAVRAALRRALPGLAAFAAIRLLGWAVLAVWSTARGASWHTLLSARWDSLWYTRIAEAGYGYTVALPDGGSHPNLAFFPLLPWLERLGSALTPLSPADAGMTVSWLSSLAAAWALYATGERLYGPRAGVALAALWGALPIGIVQSMAYSESLFTALAAWGVYAAWTGRWVWAGALASLAGLTRPVGVAVVAAVWLTAGAALLADRAGGATLRSSLARRRGLVTGVLLAPLGWCGYFLWVGAQRHSLTGYLDVQGAWGNGFDGGLAFGRFLWGLLSGPGWAGGLGLTAGVALVLVLYAAGVRRGQPLPLLTYCGVVVFLALTAKGFFGSKPRLMLPAYPLLLPLAAGLARWRPLRAGLLIGAVAVGSALYGAFWLNGTGPP